jgi:hypothetical protein
MFVTVKNKRDSSELSINLEHVISTRTSKGTMTVKLTGRQDDVQLVGPAAKAFADAMRKYRRSKK